MHHLLLALLLSVPLLASGSESLPIVLVNGSGTDITAETEKNAPVVELLPEETKPVSLQQLRWLRFGQLAYKYNVAALQRHIARLPKPVVLQAHTNGKLYLLPQGSTSVQPKLPAQPPGFPIVPAKTVDLT
jgi:hypothetical protein